MCAIFGITGQQEAANLAYLGLHALQHRGQEGAGIVTSDGKHPYAHRRKGLVNKVFSDGSLKELKGQSAIGHTRYSTTGASIPANLQPILMKSSLGWISVAHNGNLTNAAEITQRLEAEGSIFQSSNDTEVIVHLMAKSQQRELPKALAVALREVQGAYSLIAMNENYLVAVRDPHGFRPLVMGVLNGKPVFASETAAFNLIGAEYEREVQPGEMVVVDIKKEHEIRSLYPLTDPKSQSHRCIFEYIYLARPDSRVYGKNVHEVRKKLGQQLAKEHPSPDAEVVIPVPDSGVPAAIGFAEAAKIPFDMGIIRSHYIGRTFIEPQQSIRDFGVKLKLNPVKEAVEGKEIVVVDDSLVRGTTSKKLVRHLREAGARKVHIRISSPPITHSCYYGIDTPTRSELIAATQTIEFISDYLGADSLGYLSLTGLIEVAGDYSETGFCHACFSGEYPTQAPV